MVNTFVKYTPLINNLYKIYICEREKIDASHCGLCHFGCHWKNSGKHANTSHCNKFFWRPVASGEFRANSLGALQRCERMRMLKKSDSITWLLLSLFLTGIWLQSNDKENCSTRNRLTKAAFLYFSLTHCKSKNQLIKYFQSHIYSLTMLMPTILTNINKISSMLRFYNY